MDAIFNRFLENAFTEAMELSQKSAVLRVRPLPPHPPSSYLCEYHVHHLRRTHSGVVEVVKEPVILGVHFPEDYLRSTDPQLYLKVASLLSPLSFVHPNVWGGSVCLGSRFAPGTGIGVLLRELYEIVCYRNLNLVESNAMNAEACRLLRAHPHLLEALRPEPFLHRRRPIRVTVEEI